VIKAQLYKANKLIFESGGDGFAPTTPTTSSHQSARTKNQHTATPLLPIAKNSAGFTSISQEARGTPATSPPNPRFQQFTDISGSSRFTKGNPQAHPASQVKILQKKKPNNF